jgi:hypothetical protein
MGKLKMLGQRIGQRRDATRALSRVRTRGAAIAAPCPRLKIEALAEIQADDNVCSKSAKSQGFGDRVPIQEMIFFHPENLLTKGGESPSG